MSLIYKMILFMWFIYLMCIFVHFIGIFPSTPFDDIEHDPAYAVITGDTNVTGLIDFFFKYDVDVYGVKAFHVSSLFILSFCLGLGVLLSLAGKDIRPLLIGLTFGGLLSILNSSWSFVRKLATGSDDTIKVFLMIIGIGVFFIFALTIAEKVWGTDKLDD